ncbi:hypothetical protein BSU04_13750 [Caballeronia sordidicola]|uniref:Uncharacterized protein n=1 Tax=Caballeronia sordidicola TaxID=196367 RepID=A0A226X5D6_CABSO|nr:hypothetical protein BSU04_13750 [Caballeronia sordidicola]
MFEWDDKKENAPEFAQSELVEERSSARGQGRSKSADSIRAAAGPAAARRHIKLQPILSV